MRLLTLLSGHKYGNLISDLFASSAELMIDFPKGVKLGVVFFIDVLLCVSATWIAYYLRLDEFVTADRLVTPVLLSVCIAIPIFLFSGLYRMVFRYSDWFTVRAVALALAIYSMIFAPVVMIYKLDDVPRTLGLLQPFFLFFGVVGSRLVARMWLVGSYKSRLDYAKRPRALIYGAGSAGRQLLSALRTSAQLSVVGLIDDDPSKCNRSIDGLKIYEPTALRELIVKHCISHVFLAIPSVSRTRRHQIINDLAPYRVTVRSLPSLVELADGTVTVSHVKALDIEDLLEREPIEIAPHILEETIRDQVILVTGAGGSIGSELCRQIVDIEPRILILVELSEYALYSINAELQQRYTLQKAKIPTKVIPILCSVQDRESLQRVISRWKPESIYHAAAFKHVPLVESNVIEAFKNNVLGTFNLAELSIEYQVQNFVLVSTDKAVRPTNVMGATKRLAEMTLQALNAENGGKTRLSMVRFGNVLASSGSVIPKFIDQISAGGPITVTHPDVTRYFMTIREAAQLVLHAAVIAKGGEVFLLDMGDPIKIVDLARRMIRLSGLSERDTDNLDGDIQIQYTGLRPGEKLHEELLIENESVRTVHPKIMKGDESWLALSDLYAVISDAQRCIRIDDVKGLEGVLASAVEGFSR